MINILITGVTGFTGSFLVEHICKKGEITVVGIGRHVPIGECNYKFIKCDILNPVQLKRIVENVEPAYVFHLAGITKSEDTKDIYNVNVLGTINLLDALRNIKEKIDPKILVVGSSAEYGLQDDKQPISEENALHPITGYGVSKVLVDLLGFQYYYNYGLKIIRARPFNLIGPGQSSNFVCGSLARQIVEIEQGIRKPEIFVGNLEAKRDFIDVRDVVKAYCKLLSLKRFGDVYNIGSGKCYSIKDVLDVMLDIVDIKVQIKRKPGSQQKQDIPIQISNITKINQDVGWIPNISLKNSIQDMLNYEKIKTERNR